MRGIKILAVDDDGHMRSAYDSTYDYNVGEKKIDKELYMFPSAADALTVIKEWDIFKGKELAVCSAVGKVERKICVNNYFYCISKFICSEIKVEKVLCYI